MAFFGYHLLTFVSLFAYGVKLRGKRLKVGEGKKTKA